MNMKTRLLVAFATAMVAPLALTACGGGPECGEGTTLQDDKCISTVEQVDPVECAAGTKLVEGKCELDDSGCGEDTELDGGVCVSTVEEPDPAEGCGDGTSFDEGTGKCIPTSTIECGDNTVEEDGSCVPDPTKVCAAGTSPNDDGVCVIAAASCGDNTILDPNENKCLVNDAGVYCSPNTAYDADTESCVPTNAVCDTGTTFSEDTGLCLPDATCAAGDVLLDGVCVAPITDALAKADLAGTEEADPAANNDNPDFGGTPVELTLPAMGTEYTVSGTIGAPTDLDNDGEADQDIDFYSFSATAGQTFKIAVQPEAGASLSFVVMSADGDYRRFSTLGLSAGAARKIVIPADGDYMIAVAPSFLIAAGGEGGPVGADDWNYLLTIEETAGITPADVDASMGPITGSFANLDDNLFKATNLTQGDVVNITVNDIGENVDVGFLQIWTSPTTLYRTFGDIEAGDTFQLTLPVGDVFFLFDWGLVNGANVDFDITVESLAVPEALGEVTAGSSVSSLPATRADGEKSYVTLSAMPGEVLELFHTNDENESLEVTVTAPDGTTIIDSSTIDVASGGGYRYVYPVIPGAYVIEIENASGADITNSMLTANSLTPNDLGIASSGTTLSATQPNDFDQDRREYHKFNIPTDSYITGNVDSAADVDIDARIIDPLTGNVVKSFASGSDPETIEQVLPAGDYWLEVDAYRASAGGYSITLNALALTVETEPNDTTTDASPFALADLVSQSTALSGTITGGEVDYWSFSLAADQQPGEITTFSITRSGNTFSSISWSIEDSTNTEVVTGSASNNSSLDVSGLSAGTYFLKLDRGAGSTTATNYLITATSLVYNVVADLEPNNDTTTAQVISGAYPVRITGQSHSLKDSEPEADPDYFSVTVTGTTLNVDATTSTFCSRLEVFDSTGTSVDSRNNTNPSLALTGLMPGTYYVKMGGWCSSTSEISNYTIAITE